MKLTKKQKKRIAQGKERVFTIDAKSIRLALILQKYPSALIIDMDEIRNKVDRMIAANQA